jgi:hypothetical protein
MKNLLGWLLAGVGVYIIYEKFVPNSTVASGQDTTTQPGTTPTQNATNPNTTVNSNTTQPGTVSVASYAGTYGGDSLQMVQKFSNWISVNKFDTSQMLNTDQWNWYFQQATGGSGPAPETFNISPRDSVMSYASYLNMISRFLNNVTSLQGLGMIAPANYYAQHPTGADYRSIGITRPAARPSGWEKIIAKGVM